MKISFVIPAFNEERLIAATLESLRSAARVFAERGWEWEIVVCDNNSGDRTAAIACAAGARVVFEPINQIGRARNAGAAAATGDWLIFVDADSRPSARLIAETAAQIASGRVVGGGSTIRMDDGGIPARAVCAFWNILSRAATLMAGSYLFVETAAFREIGGFSHHWFAAEEIDLGLRLRKPARASERRLVILHRHPLVTSGRKLTLYSPREIATLLAKALLTGGRSLRDPQGAHLWYDGRR